MIPVEAATKAGVLVANVPGVNARTVAEHVFFVALALLRRFRMVDRDLRGKAGSPGATMPTSRTSSPAARSASSASAMSARRSPAIAAHGFGLEVIANSRNAARPARRRALRRLDELVAASRHRRALLPADAGDDAG